MPRAAKKAAQPRFRRKEIQAAEFPERVTAGDLERFTGMSARRITELAAAGKIPEQGEAGGFPFEETTRALFEYLREQSRGNPAQLSEHKLRQAKADADSAEMESAKKAGTLMFVDDAKRMWATALVKFREVILRSGISKTAQKEITDKLQKIELEE